MKSTDPLITTIKDSCKVCYTCVRDCPAKAIRISNGQAEVVSSRCIGCGNCVRVCSQDAKKFYNSIPETRQLLGSFGKKAAIIAPSFPAEFTDISSSMLIHQIRKLGFDMVCEVAYGADLVAQRYKHLLSGSPEKRYIATTCPAIVNFVEKYHPDLVENLAPIVSPMTATARVLREQHPDLEQVVFIGPCLAKKTEAISLDECDVDSVLTFSELREMLSVLPPTPEPVHEEQFDPPHPGLGVLFPINRGLLQAAGIQEDLLSGQVVTAEGRDNFVAAIKEFENGTLDTQLLEVLSCEGCIMGAGMTTNKPKYHRRSAVSQYARTRILPHLDEKNDWEPGDEWLENHLESHFNSRKSIADTPSEEEIQAILAQMGKKGPEDELNCRACGYDTCREHAIAIYKGLAESEMCLPYTIDALHSSLHDLKQSNHKLAETQAALNNAEKLASMGQLSAGIAHEINNPLGVILLFANTMLEEANPESEDYEDLQTIVEQANRVRKIASGLLDFSRKNEVALSSVNIDHLIANCLRAIETPQNIRIHTESELDNPDCQLDADQFIQVITNLVKNAMEAMPDGGDIHIRTRPAGNNRIQLEIQDTGTGISKENLGKIFEPFFTTKKMGEGTGLGLAVIYGIIKMHRGQIDVVSNNDPKHGATGTTFTVTVPRQGSGLGIQPKQLN